MRSKKFTITPNASKNAMDHLPRCNMTFSALAGAVVIRGTLPGFLRNHGHNGWQSPTIRGRLTLCYFFNEHGTPVQEGNCVHYSCRYARGMLRRLEPAAV